MAVLKVVDTINKWIEPFKGFISKHHDNPLLWLGLFLGGIAIWSVVFGILHQNGD